tara:strand:- start:1855 stop:3024 length:1170 start_codon:yes stop_codon:yes gene_type:complete
MAVRCLGFKTTKTTLGVQNIVLKWPNKGAITMQRTFQSGALRAIACGLLCFWVLTPKSLFANDVDLSVNSPVSQGTQPSLVLKLNKAVDRLEVVLRSNGQSVRQAYTGETKGKTIEIEMPQNQVGLWRWQGKLKVTFADGSAGQMPLAFSTEVRQPPQLRLHRSGLDLIKKELKVVFGAAAQKVEMEVVGENGETLAKKTVPFRGEKRGTPLHLKWETNSEVKVMKIALVAHDVNGFFSPTLALYPWSLAIPHEEVVFETASNAILDAEVPKLKDVLPRIQKRIQQYSSLIPVRLFVLGHTDTVGPADTNRALSQKRASAIARWFQNQGIKVPIFIRGFGESDLRVTTGDNVDEAANRRADYILSVNPPNHRSWQGWVTIQGQKPSGDQ